MKIKENIISEPQLDDISQGKRDEIITSLEDIIFSRIVIEVVSKLSKEERNFLFNILKKDSPNKDLASFLIGKFPNFESLVENISKEIVFKFKQEVNS